MVAFAKSITLIFLLQGTIIGVIGTIVGAAAGALTAVHLDRYRLITIPAIYQVSYLPFKLMPGDLAAVVIGALVGARLLGDALSLAAGGAVDPAQALRYE